MTKYEFLPTREYDFKGPLDLEEIRSITCTECYKACNTPFILYDVPNDDENDIGVLLICKECLEEEEGSMYIEAFCGGGGIYDFTITYKLHDDCCEILKHQH